jgi:uncharacterized membrane protein YoaK (UPF0700 family)
LPGNNNPEVNNRPIKSTVALWLTFIAGFVDIAGAITIYDIFSAHMTGTTVRLGEHLVQRDWNALGITGLVLASFVVGSLVGRILIEAAARAHFRSIAAITLGCETVLLICGMVLVPPRPEIRFAAVASPLLMLAAAMGFQTATLTRVGPLTVHTTFVTGMINKLSQLLSHWIFRTYDLVHVGKQRNHELRESRRHTASQARFIFSIWLLYVIGAICGTYAALHWHRRSFLVPTCMLLVAICTDLIHPLSIEEEREQSER